jgi:hypothetical protein
VVGRKTNRGHMTGDHHGRTSQKATLLVSAPDEILGTHSSFTHEMENAGRVPLDGWTTDVAESGGPCTRVAPQSVVVLARRKYRAEPNEARDSTSLGHAECEVCGGWYSGPWRLTVRRAREKTITEV